MPSPRARHGVPLHFPVHLPMPLQCRLADPAEHAHLETMIIDSFEPITWLKTADEKFGLMNGLGWRERWQLQLKTVFERQIILVGELDAKVVACATGTYDANTAMGFIDLLAVTRGQQGQGLGREMLRGMMQHFKGMGAVYAHLDCLTTNEVGNRLYEAEGFEEGMRSIRWVKKIP